MIWWCAVALAIVVAVLAGLGDRRRRNRDDLDRIGIIEWRSVQMFALIAAAIFGIVATHA